MEYLLRNRLDTDKRIGLKEADSLNILISIFLILFYCIYCSIKVNFEKSLPIYLSFFAIGLLSLFVLCFCRGFLTPLKAFFSFVLIFFAIAPMEQYTNNYNAWNHISITDDDFLRSNLLILASCLLVLLAYFLLSRGKKSSFKSNITISVSNQAFLILLLLDLIIFVYTLASGGLITFSSSSSDTILSSIQKIVRFFPVASLMIMLYSKKGTPLRLFYILSNSVIVLVLYFPFFGSVSRFLLFGTYIIILCKFIANLRIKSILPLALLFGFIIIFPAFNFFKTHTLYEISSFSFDMESPFCTVDFDAYQMFIEATHFTSANGLNYGRNILSSILFFIPRSIWSSKSLPSGEMISSFYGAWFTNLSCPYAGEFYLAFGIIGIIFGSLLLGVIVYLSERLFFGPNVFNKCISSIFIGMMIYLLRGSMLPTVAYTAALIISFLICYIVVKTMNKVVKYGSNYNI